MSRTLRSSFSRFGIAFLVVASLGVATPAHADEASDGSGSAFFSLAAGAAPVGVQYFDGGAPVIPGDVVYASVATTRAAVDSIGNSAALAGGPYLGDNVPALMGAANALGPAGPVLPPYPFMAVSQYPTAPKSVQDSGPRHLSANSSPDASEAVAQIGLAQGNPAVLATASSSKTAHDPATGALSAVADGVVSVFSLGPTLTIGQVVSHAEVSGQPGATPTKKTTLSIGSLTVMGTLVGLTDNGLAPVPGTPKTADINSLTKQLAAAGISLGLLPGDETANSIESAALVVGFVKDMPGHGLVKVQVILGRVTAKAESSAG